MLIFLISYLHIPTLFHHAALHIAPPSFDVTIVTIRYYMINVR